VISGVAVVTTLVCFIHLHARLRVHWASGIPCALCFLGERFLQLGRIAPRGRGVMSDEYLFVIAREGGRSSVPETLIMKSKSRGVLDRPVKPDDDSCLWRSESEEAIQSSFANKLDCFAEPAIARAFARPVAADPLARNDVQCFCIATKTTDITLLKRQWPFGRLLCIGAADRQGSERRQRALHKKRGRKHA